MSAPATNAEHPCNPDPYAVCECGRPGYHAFGPNVRPATAEAIEAVFEFVEEREPGETFTIPQVIRTVGSYTTPGKTVRLMERLGYVRRVRHPDGFNRPIHWQRADQAEAKAAAS